MKIIITLFSIGFYLFFVISVYGNQSSVFIFGTLVGMAIMGLVSGARNREEESKRRSEKINRENSRGY